ncbi:twin-arginine translocase TatA/TatE family subunit [Lentibacillus sp. L22]
MGKSVGKALNEFKSATRNIMNDDDKILNKVILF